MTFAHTQEGRKTDIEKHRRVMEVFDFFFSNDSPWSVKQFGVFSEYGQKIFSENSGGL